MVYLAAIVFMPRRSFGATNHSVACIGHMCVFVYAFVYAFVYLCVCVSAFFGDMCIHTQIHTQIHKHTNASSHKYVHRQHTCTAFFGDMVARARRGTDACTHAEHVHVFTHIHAYMQNCAPYMPARVQIRTQCLDLEPLEPKTKMKVDKFCSPILLRRPSRIAEPTGWRSLEDGSC